MEDPLLIIMCMFILLITYAIAGFFITVDFLHFIFCKERIYKIFRLPSELMVLCIIPYIIIFVSSMADRIKDLLTNELLIITHILTVIAYFISTYIRKTFSLSKEICLTICMIGGLCINIIFLETQIMWYEELLSPLIACSPIIILLITGLIQQYKRCRKAYIMTKDVTFIET